MREFSSFLSIVLAVCITVIGAWVLNGLLVELYSGHTFRGHELVITDTAIFGMWYFIVSLFLIRIIKKRRKVLFGIAGALIAGTLVGTTEGWFAPELSLFEKILTWLEVYFNYLVALPIFFILGWYSEVKAKNNAT